MHEPLPCFGESPCRDGAGADLALTPFTTFLLEGAAACGGSGADAVRNRLQAATAALLKGPPVRKPCQMERSPR
ncbi:hypothetical protein ATOP_13600 [Granulimonas faecalis]|uniref:Uncharacterized protein n=1 Tax=Granulimonas faecalis TaxID=2894155 RepID=A0AAV5B4N7_9ACTN|nr:hypothetical protein ATOP_13600 [Granulimonas faecalis]